MPTEASPISLEAERFNMDLLRIVKARTTVFAVALALCVFHGASSEAAWTLAVTNQWLASLAGFIGGVNVDIVCLSGWNSEGKTVRLRAKDLGPIDRVMAMDREEVDSFKAYLNDKVSVRVLYRDFPSSEGFGEVFSDPGTLPFVGQRVLVAMADLDPDGYEYYQRRLAEFQSRLDSTVSMGRRLLSGARILDLSGSQGELFRAAGCSVFDGDDKVRASVDLAISSAKGSEREKVLKELLNSTIAYDVVLLDYQSGLKLSLPSGKYPIVVVHPLDVGLDPITVIYDRYLAVWNVLRNTAG